MLNIIGQHNKLFLSRWIRNPLQTGATTPSGSALARLMAEQIDISGHGVVVELGGGTGALTSALTNAGIALERLVIIEKDAEFHRHLSGRFPRAKVLLGDALQLNSSLRELGIKKVAAIVSSLPLLLMSERIQRTILRQSYNLMDETSVFVQFTYRPGCPISHAKLEKWGLHARCAGYALQNIPPATVWRLTKLTKPVD